jgi:hypothetical protein
MNVMNMINTLAAIGTVLAAIASFRMLVAMKRQRDSAYAPRIAIEDDYVLIDGFETGKGVIFPVRWSRDVSQHEQHEVPANLNEADVSKFALRIWNVGMGPAMDVEIEFRLNLIQEIERLNGLLTLLPDQYRFRFQLVKDTVALNVGEGHNDNFPMRVHTTAIQQKTHEHAFLPSQQRQQSYALQLPWFYLDMINSYVFACYHHTTGHRFRPLPIGLDISFHDIAGNKMVEHFTIKPVFIAGSIHQTHLMLKVSRATIAS